MEVPLVECQEEDLRMTLPPVPTGRVNNSMTSFVTSQNRGSLLEVINRDSVLNTPSQKYKGPPMVTEIDWSKKMDDDNKSVEGEQRTVLTWNDINFYVPGSKQPT